MSHSKKKRSSRKNVTCSIVALVGITNAGADDSLTSEADLMSIRQISTGNNDENLGSDYIRTYGIAVSGKVYLQGSCARASVACGDGTAPILVSGKFPLKAKHTYQDGDLRSITVTAAPGFTGIGYHCACRQQARKVVQEYWQARYQ